MTEAETCRGFGGPQLQRPPQCEQFRCTAPLVTAEQRQNNPATLCHRIERRSRQCRGKQRDFGAAAAARHHRRL